MLKYLLEKEFKQFVRNKFLPKLVFGMPILVILLFPWAATMEVKDFNLSIVDHSHSITSQRLISKIASTGYFRIANVSSNSINAVQCIEYGTADAIIEIPFDFEESLVREGKGEVLVSANAVNATKAGLGASYLSYIISDFSTEFSRSSPNSAKITANVGGIDVVPYFKFNPKMDYKLFMVPALMVMILTLICGFLPSLNVVSEKEIGTIEQINVTPIPKYLFILGKLIPYWIIGLIMLTIALLLAYVIYGFWPQGSLLSIYVVSLVYIFSVSGMGIIISNYSNNMQQAMYVTFFFVLIMFLMSGLLTPVSSMPNWGQAVAALSPLTYFARILRAIYLKGSGILDVLPDLGMLVVFFISLTSFAVVSYRKRG